MNDMPVIDFQFDRGGLRQVTSLGGKPYMLMQFSEDQISVLGGGLGPNVEAEIVKEFLLVGKEVFGMIGENLEGKEQSDEDDEQEG